MKIIFLLSAFVVICFSQHHPMAHQLARAERSFSAASEKIGIKESFLQFLSDDCLMFNPYPVNGKELYRQRPASATYLTWLPSFVEVSASGDFGIASGPWEYRKTKNDTSAAYGHYFSVWIKQKDGTWKVALDNGISYPKKEKREEGEYFKDLAAAKPGAHTGDSAMKEILEREQEFIGFARKNGSIKAYSRYAAANIRMYRNGSFPSGQKKDAIALINVSPKQVDFSLTNAKSASSGDLGFTYGFSVDVKNDTSSFIRVWRKEKEWKIAVDMLEPFKK